MTASNFSRALSLLLVHEGGKSDDPHDPGGRTNYGITHIDYDAYRKSKGLPTRDVFEMTDDERDDIYRTRYWDPIQGDSLPSGLDYVVFDGAVNSGIAQSVKWLQRALDNVTVDGQMGALTLSAVARVPDERTLIRACCEARSEFLRHLKTFQYFGKGWISRVNDVETTALAWAAGGEAPTAVASVTAPGKAARTSAVPAPSTLPGDTIAAASAAVLAALQASSNKLVAVAPTTPTVTPAAPTATPVVPAGAPASAPAVVPPHPPAGPPLVVTPSPVAPVLSPATRPLPPAPGNAAPHPAVVPAPAPVPKIVAPVPTVSHPAVAAPSRPLFTVTPNELIGLSIVLGLLLVLGLWLSWSARSARTRRADALGDSPTPETPLVIAPEPATTAPAAQDQTSVPLVENAYARAASMAWIAFTIVVNVIVLAKMLQSFGFARNDWHGPFVMLGNVYDTYAVKVFTITSQTVVQQFGFSLPNWVMPILILYLSTASAFVVASAWLLKRDTNAETFIGAMVNGGWIFAIPAFVMDAIRYRVVTRFARQNTSLFFAYILAFLGCYIAARFVNDDFFPDPPAATVAMSSTATPAVTPARP